MHVAAFLRAINVGGRRVTNAVLIDAVVAGGLADVSAYQAAGNLVVDDGDRRPDEVEVAIEQALETALGYRVETMVRSGEELHDIAARTPFTPDQVEAAVSKPHVVLLKQAPSDPDAVLALATDQDLLALDGRELHWLPVGGMQKPTVDPQALGHLLGPATARTVGTLERMAKKYFA